MSSLEPQEYVTETVDARGRVNIGTSHAGERVTYMVFDPDSLEREAGPSTKTVGDYGRLSIGTEFAGEEVTVGIVDVDVEQ